MSPALDVPEGYKLTEAVLSTRKQWPIARLGAVATLQRGYDLPHRERKPGVVPIVTSSGFGATHSEARVCGPGVVTGRYGTIGDVYVVEEDFWPLNTTLYVKDFHDNDPAFVAHLLRTIDFHMHSGKSGVPGVNRNDLHEIDVRVPPLHEQRAIATALSDVDALLAKLDQLIAKKRYLKQAAMQQLLTGQTRLPGFSGEWEVKRVADFGDVVTGGTPRTDVRHFWGEGFPWITPTDISRDRDMVTSERSITHIGLKTIRVLPANSVLVTCIASIGKNAILKTVGGCNQQINAVIPDKNSCAEFLYYLFEFHKPYLQASAGTTATSLISKAAFQELIFNVPVSSEQTAIATVLSDMDAELAALVARQGKTRALKQGMMQALLTGRIRLI